MTRAALCFYWSCPTHGPHVLYYTCSLPHVLSTLYPLFATALPVHFCCRERSRQFEFLIQTSSPTAHIKYVIGYLNQNIPLQLLNNYFCRLFFVSTLNNNIEEVEKGDWGERYFGGAFLGGGHLCLGEGELS